MVFLLGTSTWYLVREIWTQVHAPRHMRPGPGLKYKVHTTFVRWDWTKTKQDIDAKENMRREIGRCFCLEGLLNVYISMYNHIHMSIHPMRHCA